MWQMILMWSKLQIKNSTFGVLASSLRLEKNVFKFSCKLYKHAWGIKDIKINMGDFCSKRGSLKDTRPVLPSCDEHIFPAIELIVLGFKHILGIYIFHKMFGNDIRIENVGFTHLLEICLHPPNVWHKY